MKISLPPHTHHHESAHAVAARAIGLQILEARLRDDGTGEVKCEDITAGGAEGRYQLALLSVAGPAAQCVVLGHKWHYAVRNGGADDFDTAVDAVGENDVSAIFLPMATRLIVARRAALDALAAELLAARVLAGPDVVAILDAADPTLVGSIASVSPLVALARAELGGAA